ncbi:hypothetical protein [Magnetospirillum molischianum]|uniref:Uncharacterized protein n=1 Tax=Magnetospirillum molischianum DSM 120 TaxID=1150626 RepID=H8FYE6_MAGML|nr:hypothetical protein [Magnetospirillum molischianum]CCG43212.1 hypothetical protein PHAMO_80003 [Magnetospirillum molischianum DSM 120]CCG43384.1 hypothetical protein PHAMO_80175 [Magnetospirillum molischianum DSM 120]
MKTFFEEIAVNAAGRRVRVRRAHVRPRHFYVVSVDGVRIDSFLNLARARRLAKTLFNTLGPIESETTWRIAA